MFLKNLIKIFWNIQGIKFHGRVDCQILLEFSQKNCVALRFTS